MANIAWQSKASEYPEERELKLLLVDEDASDLDYYAEILRYLGYSVVPINSYVRAAATLGRERFDLVIVDQGSANFEGRSVLSRAVELDRHVPVLVLTRAVDVQKPLTAAEVRGLVSDYVKAPGASFQDIMPYEMPRSMAGAGSSQAADDAWRKAS
jgi:response regulator RpfG family c-di-GMP phosphodiesterase